MPDSTASDQIGKESAQILESVSSRSMRSETTQTTDDTDLTDVGGYHSPATPWPSPPMYARQSFKKDSSAGGRYSLLR